MKPSRSLQLRGEEVVRRDDINKAIAFVQEKFPFTGYFRPESGAYSDVSRTVLRWIRPPAKLLDFGAGPCDKTAVLSRLGFECSACDDLNDDWHLIEGNRRRIMEFARQMGIQFTLTEGTGRLPFRACQFDALLIHDVLEHLHDSPRSLLLELLELVKPDGLVFVTVPNAVNLLKRAKVLVGRSNLPAYDSYYWYPGPWRGHIREYTKGDLREFSTYLDLEILELRGVHHALHVVPSHLKPLWIVFTGLLRSGRDAWSLVARKRPNWSPKEASREEREEILGRHTAFRYHARP